MASTPTTGSHNSMELLFTVHTIWLSWILFSSCVQMQIRIIVLPPQDLLFTIELLFTVHTLGRKSVVAHVLTHKRTFETKDNIQWEYLPEACLI